ncbi:MAG TPA: lipid A deacylase LpxR family protein [Gemmatimonadaceae bacterium]|nr:lipid A deacylase LpxR family protein [Gemmatimonadaceae bacterium]
MSRRLQLLCYTLLVTVLVPNVAHSQWSVQEDNGNLAVWVPSHRRSDDNYTQGLRVTSGITHPWKLYASILGVPTDSESRASQQFAFGQEIYTPTRYPVDPMPGQRPYAGWLYGELSTSVATGARHRSLTTDLGVIGPQSLAGWVQNTFHEITRLGPPVPGWRHQLAFQPGLTVRYGEQYLLYETTLPHGVSFALAPDWNASIGNVLTGTSVGARGRIGLHSETPWGDTTARPFDVYLVVGAHEDWVLRNVFLVRTSALPFTSSYDIGPATRLFGYTIELRLTTQTREYRGGPVARFVGSVIVGHMATW